MTGRPHLMSQLILQHELSLNVGCLLTGSLIFFTLPAQVGILNAFPTRLFKKSFFKIISNRAKHFKIFFGHSKRLGQSSLTLLSPFDAFRNDKGMSVNSEYNGNDYAESDEED